MYIYIIKIHSQNTNQIINKKNNNLTFLPIKAIQFPENYIKIFLAKENPNQIYKEHKLIYSWAKIEIEYFSDPILIKNFHKIKEFFDFHPNCPFIYWCPDFNKIKDIFSKFSSILVFCTNNLIVKHEEKIVKKDTIYTPLKNLLLDLSNKKEAFNSFTKIKYYNPCYKIFKDFSNTKSYELLYNIYKNILTEKIISEEIIIEAKSIEEMDETNETNEFSKNQIIKKNTDNILTYMISLQNVNNENWAQDLINLEKEVEKEEMNNLNIDSLTDTFSIVNFKEENGSTIYFEYSVDNIQNDDDFDIIVFFKERFSNIKHVEYDSVKIKLLEKGYFSEFEIVSEFGIPKQPEITQCLKEQINSNPNTNINEIEKALINFNEYLQNKNITLEDIKDGKYIKFFDQKELINIKRNRVLKNYLFNYTYYKEKTKISISNFFNNFIAYLAIYYPGYNNYFHHKNFSSMLKDLEYEFVRKAEGSFILNLQIKSQI